MAKQLSKKRIAYLILTTPLWILWWLWVCGCVLIPFGFDKLDYASPWSWGVVGAWAATVLGFVAYDRIQSEKKRVKYLGV